MTPNIVFIYTDQQTYRTLGCYGNDLIRMPNLNRLAERSVVFENAYVTQPVCTPSRSSIVSGLYPHATGCVLNDIPLKPETKSLAEMLTPGRFATAHHGKWHLGDEVFAQHGFSEWKATLDIHRQHYSPGRQQDAKSAYHDFLIANGQRPANGKYFSMMETIEVPEELSKAAFLGIEGKRFIEENKDNNFVLYSGFFEPHNPFTSQRDNQYKREDIPLPENFHDVPDDRHPLKSRIFHLVDEGIVNEPHSNEAEWRDLIARYWGLCSLVDTHVGVILDALEENGLMDNTAVVFTSDHGDMIGAHQLTMKEVMYEESIRVPFLLHLPGQSKQKRVSGPVSQIDLAPTLLELVNEPIPNGLHGQSLLPMLKEDNPHASRDVFITWPCGARCALSSAGRRNVAIERYGVDEKDIEKIENEEIVTIIRPDGWKLIASSIGDDALYHIFDDPFEKNNLVRSENHRSIVTECRNSIKNWCREVKLTPPF